MTQLIMKTTTQKEKQEEMKKPYTHYYHCIKCGRHYGTDRKETKWLKGKERCPLCSGHNKYSGIVRRIIERNENKTIKI